MPLFHKKKRWLLFLSSLPLFLLLFAACGENSPSILDTHGPVASSEGTVFWVIFGIATFVFVAVEGALIFSISRYREQPGMDHPRQIHGNNKLELLWTIIPSVFLVIILVFTVRGLLQVAPEAEPDDPNKVTVTAVAHQWWWEFYYPGWGFTTADTLEVPTNTVVHVNLFSNNVIHSFWVPQLTGKTDVVPGHNNTRWFKASNTGTFMGICAEYCGTEHGEMRFDVKAVDPNAFQTWVHTQQLAAASPSNGGQYSAANGLAIFQQNCTSCHGIVGVDETKYNNIAANCNSAQNSASNCPLGPNLTHFGSRDLIAGGVLINNKGPQCNPDNPKLLQECNLAKWLHDPQGIKPGNDMAIGQLSDDQIRNLVAYLESLN